MEFIAMKFLGMEFIAQLRFSQMIPPLLQDRIIKIKMSKFT